MFRRALDYLGGIYQKAPLHLFLGAETVVPVPGRWLPHLQDNVEIHWCDPLQFREHSYDGTADSRWRYAYDGCDIVIFCDADTLPLAAMDDLLGEFEASPAVMGVIAHYPWLNGSPESYHNAWRDLAARHAKKPIRFDFRHTFIRTGGNPGSASCPFYINYGFVVASPQLLNSLRATYLAIRPQVKKEIQEPFYCGQIALALAILARSAPVRSLPMRYNFPNDPTAEELWPEELENIKLVHYLRTGVIDRTRIFTTEAGFSQFLEMRLTGANQILQSHVHALTGGRYPFGASS